MQAMILAAGFGTRLLPHTRIRPKPLFPILNTPLLLLTVERLKKLGFDHIVVNCHHLKEQIVEALAGVGGVVVQEEEVILGTGGGLRKAMARLRDEPLLVTNGDIYHSIDLIELYNRHRQYENSVTLAMHYYPRFNTVTVIGGDITSFDTPSLPGNLAFTGIHIIEPSLLAGIKNNTYSCIIDHYRKLLREGENITCCRVDGCYWTDMGTPEDYLNLHGGLLHNTIPCWEEIGPVQTEFYIHPDAIVESDAHFQEWACVGAADVGAKTQLERVIIWDNVTVGGGSKLSDTLVSENFKR